MESIKATMQRMIDGIRANPDSLLPRTAEMYPGITEAEARELAAAFVGLLEPSIKNREPMLRDYKKQVEQMRKKYPRSKRDK